MAKYRLQERREFGRRHLAGGHGELAVLDGAKAADVAGNRHIVGRIGEHHLRPGVAEQLLIGLESGGIAADQAMVADPPDVAQTGDRRASRDFNDGVCRIVIVQASERSPIKISISGSSKPVTVTSRSISSSVRYCSSRPSKARSQPAFSASRLSAIT